MQVCTPSVRSERLAGMWWGKRESNENARQGRGHKGRGDADRVRDGFVLQCMIAMIDLVMIVSVTGHGPAGAGGQWTAARSTRRRAREPHAREIDFLML